MRFMILVKANADSEAGILPPAELFEEMGKYNQKLKDAGVLIALDGLHASSKGARVRFEGGSTTVVDGPFAETKELLAGFWMIEVASKEEAIEWARKAPMQDTELEIRQVFELSDFPPELISPELRAQEEAAALRR